MKKRYELQVRFDTGHGEEYGVEHIPIWIKFFSRVRARAIIKSGLKYKDDKTVVYISPYRILSVKLQVR